MRASLLLLLLHPATLATAEDAAACSEIGGDIPNCRTGVPTGAEITACCDPSLTCFTKTDGFGQCRSECPVDIDADADGDPDWACAITGSPTPAPTAATDSPTLSPTAAPTAFPTLSPTETCVTTTNCRPGGVEIKCCDDSHTCFARDDTYGQCKAECTNTEWDCFTEAPTPSPTPVPTQAPTETCVDNTNCRPGGVEKPCCDESLTCFKRDETYGQCKSSCGNNEAWECWTAAPTLAPTASPTIAPTETCVSDTNCRPGGVEIKCCDDSHTCFARDDTYGQCKAECTNTDWDCYTEAPTGAPSPAPTIPRREHTTVLRDAGELNDLPIGCVINSAFIIDPSKVDKDELALVDYLELAETQFNFLTEENGCKWRYSWKDDRERCVDMLELAEEYGMGFRGHALVWGKAASNPDFFDEECVYDEDGNLPGRCKSEVGTYTVEEKYEIMIDHVKEEAEFYAGRLAAWDVVNEAVCDCWLSFASCDEFVAANPDRCGLSELYSSDEINVYLKKNIYWPDMPDYISVAFEETKKYDTTAKLGYNEYKFEASEGWHKGKSDMTYQLIKSLKEQGVPIDYVGSQTHIDLGYMTYKDYPDWETDMTYLEAVEANIQRYADIGVEWHYTEITVAMESTEDTWDEQAEADQSFLYKGLLDLCLENEACTCFQMWGFVDGWTLAYEDLFPYPFDVNYEGKTSFTAMMESLDDMYGTCYNENTNCRVGGVANDCCDNRLTCFEKSEYYGQCLETCEGKDDTWACYEEPGCTADMWGVCTSDADCCEEGTLCYQKTEHYSQCRFECPEEDAWMCHYDSETSVNGSTGELIGVGLALTVMMACMTKYSKRMYMGCKTKEVDEEMLNPNAADFDTASDMDGDRISLAEERGINMMNFGEKTESQEFEENVREGSMYHESGSVKSQVMI